MIRSSLKMFAAGVGALALVLGTPVLSATPSATPSAQVTGIPPDAEIIFASSMAGKKDPWGFPARELYASRADGSHLTQITHAGFSHNHFEVSPDRRWIFTNRYSRGDTTGDGKIDYRDFKELWLIDLKTRTERRVLEGVDGGYGGVAWSPDSRFVYFSIRQGKSSNIQRWPIAGGPMVSITDNINSLLKMPGPDHWVSDVDASPDGKWLAMLYSNGFREDPTNVRKTRIVLYKLDRSEARFVTDGGPMAAGQYGTWPAGDFDPDFSSDGKAISFQRATSTRMMKKGNSTSDMMRQNLDGTGLTLLSPRNNQDQAGISSYGGPRCQVVWSVWRDDEPSHIEIANQDGSDRKEIRFKGEVSHVQWIPPNPPGPCKAHVPH